MIKSEKQLEIDLQKELIKLEKLRIEREKISHKNRIEQLQIKKEIALIYRSKKQLNKIKKQEKEILDTQ